MWENDNLLIRAKQFKDSSYTKEAAQTVMLELYYDMPEEKVKAAIETTYTE
jgi:hypothetical protein